MNVEINGARIIATFENVPLFGTVTITQTLIVSWLILILMAVVTGIIFKTSKTWVFYEADE